jgi:hypothetical protein
MMSFEDQLRRRLADAAQSAPAFSGVAVQQPSPAPRAPRPRTRVLLLVAAAAVVVVAAGAAGTVWALRGPATPSASCAAQATFGGRTYVPAGDLVRVPRAGPRVGSLTLPRCDDGQGLSGGEALPAYALAGVGRDAALLADDTVWLREGAATPEPLRELFRPVRCQGAPATVAGHLRGIDAEAATDFAVRAPYTATLLADQGATLPLGAYSAVVVQVQVTEETVGGTDAALLRAALAGGRRITVTVECSGPEFTASQVRLAP